MRIAVTYQDRQVFQHFGHTQRFKVYDVENGAVTIATTVNTNGSGHGALADILKKIGVDTLLCGGIGAGAQRALNEAGIALYGGVTGDTDAAVQDFLAGKLRYDPDVACEHHGQHHDGDCAEHGDSCAEHDCGGH
ncbi:MAG: NifB/NifX family molybdenum-iron cluster-binding protein [Eubacteriales bacterium]|nr:NifB/NifX family molybdenum-iron cluster-binding protein [Eubacteriales bacterium]